MNEFIEISVVERHVKELMKAYATHDDLHSTVEKFMTAMNIEMNARKEEIAFERNERVNAIAKLTNDTSDRFAKSDTTTNGKLDEISNSLQNFINTQAMNQVQNKAQLDIVSAAQHVKDREVSKLSTAMDAFAINLAKVSENMVVMDQRTHDVEGMVYGDPTKPDQTSVMKTLLAIRSDVALQGERVAKVLAAQDIQTEKFIKIEQAAEERRKFLSNLFTNTGKAFSEMSTAQKLAATMRGGVLGIVITAVLDFLGRLS